MTLGELTVVLGADLTPLDRALARAEQRLERFGQGAERLGSALTTYVTAPLTALGVVSVRSAGQLESLEKALAAVLGSSDAAGAELERLRQTAEAPGLGFEQVVRASVQLQNVGKSADEARALIEGLGNAIALSGGGAEDFGEVNRQFTQIASLGKITAENLNVILERSPAIAQALQRAFGTSSAEAIRASGVTVDEFFAKLQEGLAALPRAEGGILNALENGLDNLMAALRPVGEAVAEVVVPAWERFTALAARASEAFAQLEPSTQRLIVVLGIVAAAAGPVLLVLGKLASVVSILRAGLVVLSAVTGPVGLALTALAVGAGLLIANWEKVSAFARERLPGALEATRAAFGRVLEAGREAGSRLLADLGPALGRLGELWEEHGDLIVAVVDKALSIVIDLAGTLLSQLLNVVVGWLQLLAGDWEGAMESFGRAAQNGMDFVVRTFGEGLQTLAAQVALFGAGIGTPLGNVLADIGVRAAAAVGQSLQRIEAARQAALQSRNEALVLDLLRGVYGGGAEGGGRARLPVTPPAPKGSGKSVGEIIADAEEALAALGERVRLGLVTPIEAAEEAARLLEGSVARALGANEGRANAAIEDLARRAREAEEALKAIRKEGEKPAAEFKMKAPSLQQILSDLSRVREVSDRTFDAATRRATELADSTKRLMRGLSAFAEDLAQTVVGFLSDLGGALLGLGGPSEAEVDLTRLDFADAEKRLTELWQAGQIGAERYRLEMALLQEQLAEFEDSLQGVENAFERLGAGILRVLGRIIEELLVAIAKTVLLKLIADAFGGSGGFLGLIGTAAETLAGGSNKAGSAFGGGGPLQFEFVHRHEFDEMRLQGDYAYALVQRSSTRQAADGRTPTRRQSRS